jgi:hypothetical protein
MCVLGHHNLFTQSLFFIQHKALARHIRGCKRVMKNSKQFCSWNSKFYMLCLAPPQRYFPPQFARVLILYSNNAISKGKTEKNYFELVVDFPFVFISVRLYKSFILQLRAFDHRDYIDWIL